MGMEDAILEMAGGLKELAAAIREATKAGVHNGDLLVRGSIAATGDVVTGVLLQEKAAEVAAAGKQQAAAARQAQEQDAAANKKAAADAAGDTTVDVIAAVSAEIEAKGTVAPDKELEHGCAHGAAALAKQTASVLDYAKDVRPMLLAAIKKGKRAEIEAHLAEAGVAKADQLKPEQLPAILELATALAA